MRLLRCAIRLFFGFALGIVTGVIGFTILVLLLHYHHPLLD